MIAIALIAIAAGLASALMFASIISGAPISLVLFYLTPLPLMAAAIGWGPLAAAIAGISAAIGLGAIFGFPFCIAFALAVAFPAWRLGYLTLLRRPLATDAPAAGDPEALEWYPIGRILLWIAAFAALTTAAAMLTLGSDGPAITETIHSALLVLLNGVGISPSERTIQALVIFAPVAVAIVIMLTLVFNLWLAAKITATSGRLQRPWPDLKSIDLPPMTLAALSVAVAFCFTDGLPAILAQIVAAVLMMAYTLIGLAVLHTLTLTSKSRVLWLGFTYTIMVAFSWSLLGMAALGLADSLFGFRQRYLQGRPPLISMP
jgi:hypothetical protein